jgi:hypothetical protein
LLRYWWKVKSIPAGAHPVFDHQCSSQVTWAVSQFLEFTSLRCVPLMISHDDERCYCSREFYNRRRRSTVRSWWTHLFPNPVSDELRVKLTDTTTGFKNFPCWILLVKVDKHRSERRKWPRKFLA